MTTEEKAKAYDEALKVLHKYDGANIMFSQSLKEEMFPELKKNEDPDEKVRKALIKLVTNHASMDLFIEYDIHLDEALNYLEKKCVQKPAWSEEDKKMVTAIKKLISDVEDDTGWNCVYNDDEEIHFSEINNWLKSLKERVQQKQEWSKEEQQTIKDAASFILSCVNTIETKEEEERLEELADKLQDLRPQSQWKPSDEQIEYLTKAIVILNDEGNCKTASILNDLRVELKKLREL